MKKHLLIAGGLAAMSTTAFGTVSRMNALQQDTAKGSYYISDTRNVFRTAGSLNETKNYAVIEGARTDGGFFRSHGSFNYGLYLGDTTYGNLNGDGTNTPASMDLFLAGDAGMSWGARLGYTSYTTEATGASAAEGSSFDLGLSAEVAGANIWLNFVPGSTEKSTAGSATETEHNSDMNVGVTYGLGGWTAFFEYESDGGNKSTGNDFASTTMTIGAGRTSEGANGSKMYTDIKLVMGDKDDGRNEATSRAENAESMTIPITVGFEAAATSWLTLRGSISQSLYGSRTCSGNCLVASTTTTTEISASSTQLAAGASFNFGALQVDGDVSIVDGSNVAPRSSWDRAFTGNLSMHYWF